MSTNEELIAEAHAAHYRLDGNTGVCALDDDWWPCVTHRLADALAAVTPPVDADERERLLAIVEKVHRESWTDSGEHMDSPAAIADAILAAGFRSAVVDGDEQIEWAETLVNDGEFEFTVSGDCDGSNEKYWKRTPRRVIEAGKWQQYFPVAPTTEAGNPESEGSES